MRRKVENGAIVNGFIVMDMEDGERTAINAKHIMTVESIKNSNPERCLMTTFDGNSFEVVGAFETVVKNIQEALHV